MKPRGCGKESERWREGERRKEREQGRLEIKTKGKEEEEKRRRREEKRRKREGKKKKVN